MVSKGRPSNSHSYRATFPNTQGEKSMRYSKKLIKKFQTAYKNKFRQEIGQEEADAELCQLARLVKATVKKANLGDANGK